MSCRQRRKELWGVAVCLVAFGASYAQRLEDAVLRNRKTAHVVFTESPIQVDGVLSEPAWQGVPPATDFIQAEPREGWPATERTEVRILYDAGSLYFGVRCYDSGPIIVNDLRHDFGQEGSDTFGIVIDTFHDERNGYLFIINAAGAKRDSQFVNEGRNEDTQWDAVWYVSTQRGRDGWTAEIRIPFNTLRFSDGDSQTWGVNFSRRVRRKNEVAYWSFLPRRYQLNRVSLAGRLAGLESINERDNFKVKPYVKSAVRQIGEKTDPDFNGGVDVKYGLAAGLTLDVTVRPDFSEAEVDTQRINLTRFGLFFPEKRDFFLENSGVFHFGDGGLELGPVQDRYTRLFYSRRIGLSESGQPIPILAGARMTGQVGRLSLGMLNMQTEETDSEPTENFTATRFKWNLFEGSDVGGIFLNRQRTVENGWNRSFGLDANLRFFKNLTFTSYLVKTGSPTLKGKDWARKVNAEWRDNFIRFQTYYSDIGENFNPELGFVHRTGVEFHRLFFEIYPRPKRNKILREFAPHVHTRYFADQDGRTLTKEIHFGYIELRFQNGATFEAARDWFFERLTEPFRIRPTLAIPVGDYKFYNDHIEFQSDRSRQISGNIVYKPGTHYDGKRKSLQGGIRLQASEHLTADLGYSGDRVELKKGSFATGVTTLRASYAFNTKAFLDVFLQYNSERKQLSSNVRFRLIHRPLSDLILVYNEERGVGASSALNRAIIFKYTHLFDF